MDKLIKLCNYFFKRATLESDMAHRIMYSVLPTVETRPGGFYDESAASQIIVSASNYLTKATKVCVEEMQHYMNQEESYNIIDKHDEIYKPNTLLNEKTAKEYVKLLQRISKAFHDKENWMRLFGGKNWANISDTLLSLGLEIFKFFKSKPGSNRRKKAINGMLVRMNVLDGISHNTGTLSEKLIANDYGYQNFQDVNSNITRMMDAKRLNNPTHVFKTIENNLDITLPYKQYIEKLRRSPGYYDNQETVDNELENIRKYKAIQQAFLSTKDEVLNNIEEIKDAKRNAKNANDKLLRMDYDAAEEYISDACSAIDNISLDINIAIDLLVTYYSEYKKIEYDKIIEMKKANNSVKKMISKLASDVENAKSRIDPDAEDRVRHSIIANTIKAVNIFCDTTVMLASKVVSDLNG